MHGLEEFGNQAPLENTGKPWYSEMNRYHWFVLTVAALGWLFDCLDQQLFILARPAAMKSLLATAELDPGGKPILDSNGKPRMTVPTQEEIKVAGNYATAIFLAGWALGGLFFGMLGDRWGRAKTMMLTILLYSMFTGLSAISTTVWDFALYRFLTGLGVGGEFAVGVALVAEVMPARARPLCLALLQALSAIGNVSAAFINLGFGIAEEQGLVSSPWRMMFIVGALPALLALIIRRYLKEPEQWKKASKEDGVKQQLGSYRELLGTPLWRKHALLGLVLACSGVIGLWAIGFFTPDLIRYVQRKGVADKAYAERIIAAEAEQNTVLVERLQLLRERERSTEPPTDELDSDLRELRDSVEPTINGRLSRWASYTSLMINFGAFLGMFGFGVVAQKIGRKPTFAMALIAACLSTAAVFWFLRDFWQIFVLVPIMGFCQLSLFAGYAIYFPELFPTRLRSTGTSFCYNVGRFVAAGGPLVQAALLKQFADTNESLRYAGVAMCGVFLIGLLVLPFLPETKDKPLPE